MASRIGHRLLIFLLWLLLLQTAVGAGGDDAVQTPSGSTAQGDPPAINPESQAGQAPTVQPSQDPPTQAPTFNHPPPGVQTVQDSSGRNTMIGHSLPMPGATVEQMQDEHNRFAQHVANSGTDVSTGKGTRMVVSSFNNRLNGEVAHTTLEHGDAKENKLPRLETDYPTIHGNLIPGATRGASDMGSQSMRNSGNLDAQATNAVRNARMCGETSCETRIIDRQHEENIRSPNRMDATFFASEITPGGSVEGRAPCGASCEPMLRNQNNNGHRVSQYRETTRRGGRGGRTFQPYPRTQEEINRVQAEYHERQRARNGEQAPQPRLGGRISNSQLSSQANLHGNISPQDLRSVADSRIGSHNRNSFPRGSRPTGVQSVRDRHSPGAGRQYRSSRDRNYRDDRPVAGSSRDGGRGRDRSRSPGPSRQRDRSRSPDRTRQRDQNTNLSRGRSRDREPTRNRGRSRSPSREPQGGRDARSYRDRSRDRDNRRNRDPSRDRGSRRDRDSNRNRDRSRDRDSTRNRDRSRSRDRDKERKRGRDRSASPPPRRERSRDRDRDSRGGQGGSGRLCARDGRACAILPAKPKQAASQIPRPAKPTGTALNTKKPGSAIAKAKAEGSKIPTLKSTAGNGLSKPNTKNQASKIPRLKNAPGKKTDGKQTPKQVPKNKDSRIPRPVKQSGSSRKESKPKSNASKSKPQTKANSSKPQTKANSAKPQTKASSAKPQTKANSAKPQTKAGSSKPSASKPKPPSANKASGAAGRSKPNVSNSKIPKPSSSNRQNGAVSNKKAPQSKPNVSKSGTANAKTSGKNVSKQNSPKTTFAQPKPAKSTPAKSASAQKGSNADPKKKAPLNNSVASKPSQAKPASTNNRAKPNSSIPTPSKQQIPVKKETKPSPAQKPAQPQSPKPAPPKAKPKGK